MNDPHGLPSERPRAEGTPPATPPAVERRSFLGTVTVAGMVAGLVACYGTFFAFAARYLFPSRRAETWMFVARAAGIAPGESVTFVSPAGVPVTVKRRAGAGAARAAVVEDFAALSSTCPHLGCRVHWEQAANRFFCPCHNGSFDPEGAPTGGPPLAAGQHLPRYPLRLEGGMLFIEMPAMLVGARGNAQLATDETTDEAA